MTDDEADMREQLRDAFAGADYPVENQMDLVPALPNGPTTRFEAGETTITAMELGTKLSSYQEFPYEDVDTLVDNVITGMKTEGML
jgi:hypothetical protein